MKVVDLGQMNYDGSQLHHAFAYEQDKALGPTICCFRGAANVKDHLVDLEDSLANDFIKSEEMWHFIIEIPEATIIEAVVWQRLFIAMCVSHLCDDTETVPVTLDIGRNGDDILVEPRSDPEGGYEKLSVSIATLSRFSGLIHVGINIVVGEGCPVAATGLRDFVKDPEDIDRFGRQMARAFAYEYVNIKKATYKVIGV